VNSAKPNNRRPLLFAGIAAVVLAIVGLVTYLALAAGSGGADHQPDTTTTTTTPAAQPRQLIAMVEHGEQHAMLSFKVYPEGGQVTGTYTLVHFDGAGKKVPVTEDINGSGSGSTFTLEGLGDYGPVVGTLSADGTRLEFDQTFGVEEYVWQVIPSESVFDAKVTEYAKRFESCSKKHDYNPCEGVS
jgi:hypothetical protein